MTPVELSRTVLRAVRRAVDDGELTVVVPARVVIERPRPGGSGDYSSNVALQLARDAGAPPRQVAEILRDRILQDRVHSAPGVAGVEITGPGFLNFTLDGADAALVRDVLSQGLRYGHSLALDGERIELRIPAHEPRAEVVADAVSRIVAALGGHVDVLQVPPGGTPGGTEDPSGRTAEDPVQPANLHPVPAPPPPATPLGPDPTRWALLHSPAHDRPRLTPDHLVQRESNPLFRVQYAHSRARALVRGADQLGFHPQPGHVGDTPEAQDLLTALADYPVVLATAARNRAPDRLARHLVATADAFFRFHDATRVLPLGDEKPSAAHRARLALAEAAGTVLAGGLSLLGIDAPEHV
ncbi:ArgS-related anticodon-binding protein NrtL [Streptomyces sp. NPDC002896]|uniref:ArgS-related anticodon-binding protein NrtL n=1 Tax=Streptomyces sp. NPDC002896 TaxID=3154438 RepID=UPI003331E6C7